MSQRLMASAAQTGNLDTRSEDVARRRKDASDGIPFSDAELDSAIRSLQNLALSSDYDWQAIRDVVMASAHISHKSWPTTAAAASKLASLLGGPEQSSFQEVFQRVLEGGNWAGAAKAAAEREGSTKPWVVLVTGVNGIRKTSSIYQPWFRQLLEQSISPPATHTSQSSQGEEGGVPDLLPDGGNSFFRQLDFILATVANDQFESLYRDYSDDMGLYAACKDTIFMRYRTLAEMVGLLLVEEVKKRNMNIMVETSGRDIAMFKYVDQFFADGAYNKLVLHFDINDIRFAEQSVDTRMQGEVQAGLSALEKVEVGEARASRAVIQANAGGPYGSKVLQGVQEDSNKVWKLVSQEGGGEEGVGQSWYTAAISINADDTRPWFAKPASGGGEEFIFEALAQ